MNKTAIKNFAIWARNKLIADITYKAGLLGITEKDIKSPLPQSSQTVQFFDIGTKEPSSITGYEIEQRKKLIEEIRRKAYQSDYSTAYKNVIEEVAYTWFNRLIAIRFMEVNDYLPSRIRVLSSESNGKAEPDLVTHAMGAGLDYSAYEKDRIIQLKHENKLDELFRMLFIKQCNALNENLPELFEKTSDYSELLLNVSIIDKDGVVYHLVNDISEDDFNVSKEGQIEIIGWLYQYYNTEPKDETFALLKKNVKITKERIPAATQLFTPDWIVRYMVENSLGRLWLEGHPNDELKANWKYYLDEAKQEDDVQKQLDKIREEYKTIKPEDIKIIDPAMGSGHILVYAFDVLMQIYESYGYSQRDAAKNIVEQNLFGLDIDNRAYQLAYFAVMMKARQYSRRILNGETKCNIYAIQESNEINRNQLKYFGAGLSEMEKNTALLQIQGLLDTFTDAKEYGSILIVENYNWQLLYRFIRDIDVNGQMSLDTINIEYTRGLIFQLVEIGEVMAQKYAVVVTNPPYMGSNGMGDKLAAYVSSNYPKTKSDLSTVFMEKTISMCIENGVMSMINIPVWMFLISFEKQREDIVRFNTFSSLLHFGRGVFGADFGTVAFVIKKRHYHNYRGQYMRLFDKPSSVDSLEQKVKWFVERKGLYNIKQENFAQISGKPVAYWVSASMLNAFASFNSLGKESEPRQGLITGDNDRFLRKWYEVYAKSINHKWFIYNKGGDYRKWYGNNDLVVNWENNGFEIKNFINPNTGRQKSRPQNIRYYFREGFSWTTLSIGAFSARHMPNGQIFDAKGSSCFANSTETVKSIMGLTNSKVGDEFFKILSPTVDYSAGSIGKLPVSPTILNNSTIANIVDRCINLSKFDWDSFETSWNFKRHPLLKYMIQDESNTLVMRENNGEFLDIDKNINLSIENAFKRWQHVCEERFQTLKHNEEELNRIFIDIYSLQEELTPEVADINITISRIYNIRDDIPANIKGNNYVLNKADVMKSFISYAVGCIFGRFSLDIEGLAYAGGDWDKTKYKMLNPDMDNILPINDEEYYDDDITGLLVTFVKKVYGTHKLEDNLDFIAIALGNKGNSSREIIRNYFLNDFFKDHCKIYGKRPIYWLFDSGKQNGFKALVYMHRYDENTIGNLRIDYLHRMQRIYENEIARMQDTIENSKDAREVTAAMKRKEKLIKQLQETKEYDEKIAHLALARISIDLDDGVKVNYEKIQTDTDGKKLDVLAKI